jgi:K+-transporting ATPase ATPase A chain
LASQVAIAEFGTNGSGFFDASAAHPFINPSGLSNLIEGATLYAAGLACLFAFGRATHERRQAITLVASVTLAIGAVCAVIYFAETAPTPASLALHAPVAANLEGKEVRFGAPATAAFAAMSNGARDGSLDADLESFTPLGSGAAMSAVLLGGMLPGSAGSGLVSVLLFSLLAVVVGGMVVGRTPEFLGKKVEARETRLALAALLVVNLSILGFSALASVAPAGLAARSATGAQGLTEIVYGYMSAAANTGSAFPGLHTDGVFWGLTLGAAMALGRYGLLLPAIAVAGSLAAKPKMRPTEGALPTDGPLFVGLLLAVLLLFSGLQYFPALALGPVEEQLQMNKALSAAAASLSPRPSRRTAPF